MATARIPKINEKAIEMNQLLLNSNRFVVVDIETTTFSPKKGGKIIEVAGIKVEDGKIVGEFSQLIDPQVRIPAQITELTSITNDMVKGKPVYGQVLPEFYQFIGDAVFVAHNAMFDWDRFLLYYFEKVGIIAKNPVICTRILAKMYFPYWKEHKLNVICDHEEVTLDSHHRALDDSLALANVLLKWKNREAPKYDASDIAVPATSTYLQQDLFGLTEKKVIVSNPVEEAPATFKVKRVSYWEKDITKEKKMRRVYALLSIGTVFYDIPSNAWYNKDVKSNLDFKEIERRILAYLKLDNREELKDFRGVK